MLTLTRRVGEVVVIGDGIEVKILEVTGNRIRLGITAPPWIPVLRKELLEALGSDSSILLADEEDGTRA